IIGPDQHKNPDQNRGIIPMGRVLIGNQGQKHQGGNHIKNDHHVFAPLEKRDFPNDHQVSDQQDIDDQGRKHQQQGQVFIVEIMKDTKEQHESQQDAEREITVKFYELLQFVKGKQAQPK